MARAQTDQTARMMATQRGADCSAINRRVPEQERTSGLADGSRHSLISTPARFRSAAVVSPRTGSRITRR